MKRLCFLMVLALAVLCLLLPAFADEEEPDLYFRDLLGYTPVPTTAPTAAPGEATPVPSVTPFALADGSRVICITVGGRVAIGDDAPQSSNLSLFEKELRRQEYNASFLWRNISSYFLEDEFTLLCLESALTSRTPQHSGVLTAPAEHAQIMRNAGVDAVVLQGDDIQAAYGEEGLLDTQAALDQAGLRWAADGHISVSTIANASICVLSYDARAADPALFERVRAEVSEVAAIYHVVITSFLWGNERDYVPDEYQQSLAYVAVNAGSVLVVGHGGTHLQPVEVCENAYIVYSMGNLSCSVENKPSDMATYLFQARFKVSSSDAKAWEFRIIPCRAASRTEYNDFTPTPYDQQSNIDSVLSLLDRYGEQLLCPAPQYNMDWVN